MSILTQTMNPITGAMEWDMKPDQYDYHQEIARSAFADMLHDTERNQKYFTALDAAIKKIKSQGKRANVLDIGTGTGLLSMMAEKCGADTITACEAFQPVAECALKILQHNNLGNKIKIVPKRSTEMVIGLDMPQRANILVTEVFDTELIGEGALETFIHAQKHLLEEDAIVVPHSATIYAQVVECPEMQKWNKLNDLYDADHKLILRTPEKSCAGSAALHDLQLSQLSLSSFKNLSDPLPVFHFDWSGKVKLEKRRKDVKEFRSLENGVAQMVFMWWDLQMDTDGEIMLSCAPWWNHPDVNRTVSHPEDTIPWRDHWMQAIYYFPQEIVVHKDDTLTLLSYHDEFSLWYFLENDHKKYDKHNNPVCECGAHMMLSRTHVSYLNDGRRSKKFLNYLQDNINENSVVLCCNGASLLGLAAAAFKAKKVYYVEDKKILIGLIKEYAKENNLDNIEFTDKNLNKEIYGTTTQVICDPNFTDAITPWDNLRFGYFLHKQKSEFVNDVKIVPAKCSIWAMPMQFIDLQKIRIPLETCEGIDMTVFDKLVEGSRLISDDELEAQPLWEYPGFCRKTPMQMLLIDFNNLKDVFTEEGCIDEWDTSVIGKPVNGIAVWMQWDISESSSISSGPLISPEVNSRVKWDPHTRQAVKLFLKEVTLENNTSFKYRIKCDFRSGSFSINIL